MRLVGVVWGHLVGDAVGAALAEALAIPPEFQRRTTTDWND